MSESNNSEHGAVDRMFARALELQASGLSRTEAMSLAQLELRLDRWPPAWGDDLKILVFGDFKVPREDIDFPELRIRLGSTKRDSTFIRSALTVVDATVGVDGKTVSAVLDAMQRINVLLGAITLTTWANSSLGWWCSITHGSGGGVISDIDAGEVGAVVANISRLPKTVRRKLDAALYWTRIGRPSTMGSTEDGTLRAFVSYWNAFECLVDVVHLLRPRARVSKTEKQSRIDEALNGVRVTPELIATLHRTIVDPGFTAKATYALEVCFGDRASRYVDECFRRVDVKNRLYKVRNSIAHGDIDAENPHELARIEERLTTLGVLLLMVFARIIGMRAPGDLPRTGGT